MGKNYVVYCISPALIRVKFSAKLYPIMLIYCEELPFNVQTAEKSFLYFVIVYFYDTLIS